MPAAGERTHVSRFAKRDGVSWRSLDVSPTAKPIGECGGKDQVSWAVCLFHFLKLPILSAELENEVNYDHPIY